MLTNQRGNLLYWRSSEVMHDAKSEPIRSKGTTLIRHGMFNPLKNASKFKLPIVAVAAAVGLTLSSVSSPVLSREEAATNKKDSVRLAQITPSPSSPVALYDQCWRFIRDMFYDQSYNGQNWARWQHKYDSQIKTREDSYKAIETMLASLGDPYTRFLTPEAFSDEKNQISAHLFGVGIQLGMNEQKKVVVIAPIEGSPAAGAGVLPGDEILEVDGELTAGQPLDSVVKKIRGPINTKVTLTLLRETKRLSVPITRAEIPIKAVTKAMILPGNIGYIRLDSFISFKAPQELREALRKTEGADGLILDLRNNPGGLLENSIQMANMFLDGGIIVSTENAQKERQSQIALGHPLTEKPMVTLINGSSASAAEILASALRDNNRSKLIGEKSFGKGLVQAIKKLDDGAGMNVSIAKYLTAANMDIHKKGIEPNVMIKLETDDYKKGLGPWWIDPNFKRFNREPTDSYDLQLLRAINELKNDLNKAKGLPPIPFDEAKVRKEILAKLSALEPTTSARTTAP